MEAQRWGAAGAAWPSGWPSATKHNALFLPFVLDAVRALARVARELGQARGTHGRVALRGPVRGGGRALRAARAGAGPGDGFQRKFFLLSPHTLLFVGLAAGAVWVLRDRAPVRACPRRERCSRSWRWRCSGRSSSTCTGPTSGTTRWIGWRGTWPSTPGTSTTPGSTWATLLRAPPFPLTLRGGEDGAHGAHQPLRSHGDGLALACVGRALLSLPSAHARVGEPPVHLAEALVVVNAVASIVIISHPQVPHFGGVKHWLPSMPFLAILAGVAVTRGCTALLERLRAHRPALPFAAVAVPVFALLMAPALMGLVRVFPYGTAFYSELGGRAARRGLAGDAAPVLVQPRDGRAAVDQRARQARGTPLPARGDGLRGPTHYQQQRHAAAGPPAGVEPQRRGHRRVPVPPGVPRARDQHLAGASARGLR